MSRFARTIVGDRLDVIERRLAALESAVTLLTNRVAVVEAPSPPAPPTHHTHPTMVRDIVQLHGAVSNLHTLVVDVRAANAAHFEEAKAVMTSVKTRLDSPRPGSTARKAARSLPRVASLAGTRRRSTKPKPRGAPKRN